MSNKKPFFVRRSRSPQRSGNIDSQSLESAFQEYEKVLETVFKSPANSPKHNSPQQTFHSFSKEEKDIETLSDDVLFSSSENINESTMTGPVLEAGILEDDDEPSVNIEVDNIDFSTTDEFCAHDDVIREKGTSICRDCGIELYQEISHEQDWRYFGDQDRNTTDPTRCQYRKAAEKGIKKNLEKKGFPPDVCELADYLYYTITKGDITRNTLRRGLELTCTYEAYKILKRPQTADTLQKKFGEDKKVMSRGITYYGLHCPREFFEYENISAKHFIPEVMAKFNVKQEHVEAVIKLFEIIKDHCRAVNTSNPQSAAKALVYYYLRRKGCNIHPVKYGKIVGLSDVIVMRISGEISSVLKTTTTVQLQ
jgi:transcription initiation factor TFIIIB Brf1 subunit/transcription initiation factor TFIIB